MIIQQDDLQKLLDEYVERQKAKAEQFDVNYLKLGSSDVTNDGMLWDLLNMDRLLRAGAGKSI